MCTHNLHQNTGSVILLDDNAMRLEEFAGWVGVGVMLGSFLIWLNVI